MEQKNNDCPSAALTLLQTELLDSVQAERDILLWGFWSGGRQKPKLRPGPCSTPPESGPQPNTTQLYPHIAFRNWKNWNIWSFVKTNNPCIHWIGHHPLQRAVAVVFVIRLPDYGKLKQNKTKKRNFFCSIFYLTTWRHKLFNFKTEGFSLTLKFRWKKSNKWIKTKRCGGDGGRKFIRSELGSESEIWHYSTSRKHNCRSQLACHHRGISAVEMGT